MSFKDLSNAELKAYNAFVKMADEEIELYNISILRKRDESAPSVTYYIEGETLYKFVVSHSSAREGKVFFRITRKPTNAVNNNFEGAEIESSLLMTFFKNWCNLISERQSEMDIITGNYDFTKQYEKEFTDYIIIDDDGHTKPFDNTRQLLWLDTIEAIENVVKSDTSIDEDIQVELLIEVKELKDSISTKTQLEFRKKAAKLFAKMKVKGVSLIKEVGKEIIKDIAIDGVKALFKIAIDNAPMIIEAVSKAIQT